MTGLNEDEKIMRDVLTHRAYIELGSSEVRPLWDHLSQVDLKTGTISSSLSADEILKRVKCVLRLVYFILEILVGCTKRGLARGE